MTMYCSNCGKPESSKECKSCGFPSRLERNFCPYCSEAITSPNQVICTKCKADVRRCGRNNIVAAILALLLGQYGAHKFYNGNRMLGIVYLVTTIIGYATLILLMTQKYNITDRQYLLLLLMGMLPMTVVAITSFVEAISYLTNKDKYNEKYNSIPQKSVRNYISSMFWGGVAGLLVACFLVRFVFDLNDNDVLRTDGGCIFLMIVVYWGIIGGLLFEDAPPKE